MHDLHKLKGEYSYAIADWPNQSGSHLLHYSDGPIRRLYTGILSNVLDMSEPPLRKANIAKECTQKLICFFFGLYSNVKDWQGNFIKINAWFVRDFDLVMYNKWTQLWAEGPQCELFYLTFHLRGISHCTPYLTAFLTLPCRRMKVQLQPAISHVYITLFT